MLHVSTYLNQQQSNENKNKVEIVYGMEIQNQVENEQYEQNEQNDQDEVDEKKRRICEWKYNWPNNFF